MYSLKKVLLSESIVSQRNFIGRLIDVIKKNPKVIGSFGSYDQALEYVTDLEEDKDREIEIDGLMLSSEEVKSYEEMKKEFKLKEDKRLKTIAIKKSKGIKITRSDNMPIKFNAGIFFKRSKEEKLLGFQERSICLEIIKVDSLLGLSSIKDKKDALKAEAIMTRQIAKFSNIDGTPINFKAIMPLYDKMIEYIEKSADVNVDSCICAADIFIKELYSTASASDRQEIDGGNFDFSLVFSKTNYFTKYSKNFLNEVTPIIELYEDENVKIVYPTSVASFNKEISSNKIKNGLTWCTQNIGSWQSHHKEHFVAILYDKKITDDSHRNFIISLKINYSIDDPDELIDYYETCDRHNDHMDEDDVRKIISDDVIKSLTYSVDKKLKYFNPEYVKESLESIVETLSSLVTSGRLDIAKEIISKSVTFSSHDKTVSLIKACLSNINENSERLLLKIIFEIAVDSNFYGSYYSDITKEVFDYDLIYDGVVTNLNISEFYNILFDLTQDNRAHPKYLIAILNSLNQEKLKNFLNKEKIIRACKIAFNTNNTSNFLSAASEIVYAYSRSGVLEILRSENGVKEFFSIVVSSKGFRARLAQEDSKPFHLALVEEIKKARKTKKVYQSNVNKEGFGNIDNFLSAMIVTEKESCLEILERNNMLDIVKKADGVLMAAYIDFNISSSKKGVLSLLDENEVRSKEVYAEQFDGIISSKEDFENIMIKILSDKEALATVCSGNKHTFPLLLAKSLRLVNLLSLSKDQKEEQYKVIRFLLSSNIDTSNKVLEVCMSYFDNLYASYKDIKSLPGFLLADILDYIKSTINTSGKNSRFIKDIIKKTCFNSLEELEVNYLKFSAELCNLLKEDEIIAENMIDSTAQIGSWGGISRSEVDIVRHNYVNFLLFVSSQIKKHLSEIVNKKCGKLLNVADLNRLDIDNLKAARIIVMNGTKRFLNIEQEVYDNIVNNTKRPMTKKEILLNLNILGSENVNLTKSFNKNKVKDIFDNYTKDIKLAAGGRVNNTSGLQQALELCIKGFVNLPNYKNMNVNRFYTRELIEAISEYYQVLVTNYDSKEQENLDKLIVALIENYINFNREGEAAGDAFMSIRSILERANKNSSHIFYDQKFSPVIINAIENIPKDVSGSSGSYYQEISRLFDIQDKDPAQDNTSVSKAQTEVALRSYVRMLLS